MDDNLAAQVRQRMRERNTDSLLAIWRREDGEGWSEQAYEIVRQTLEERGVTPPDLAEVKRQARAAADPADEEDVYHSFNGLMRVAGWASALSWLFLGLGALILIILGLSVAASLLEPRFVGDGISGIQWLTQGIGVLICAFFFVLSQAISQVIYLLLDIEDNTRHAGGRV